MAAGLVVAREIELSVWMNSPSPYFRIAAMTGTRHFRAPVPSCRKWRGSAEHRLLSVSTLHRNKHRFEYESVLESWYDRTHVIYEMFIYDQSQRMGLDMCGG